MKPAEGGKFGAADYKSYTFWISLIAWVSFYSFVYYDIGEKGQGYLRIAYGLQSNVWIWICIVASFIVANFPNGPVSLLYTQYSGRWAYGDDRIGYAKSGGRDIAVWSGFITLVGVLFIFAKYIPEGVLWRFRPVVLLIVTALVGRIIAVFLAKRVFHAQFGPPRYSLPGR